MLGHSTRENREIPGLPATVGRSGKAMSRKPDVHDPGKSDDRIVPTNDPNRDEVVSTEDPEGRRSTKENTEPSPSPRTQGRERESRGLLGVREVAQRDKRLRFTALLHHVSVARLRASFFALKREAVPGVDGMTWRQYFTDHDTRLAALHARVHGGTYRAQPSKRAYIAKADGRQRPLGIAALEDKIV